MQSTKTNDFKSLAYPRLNGPKNTSKHRELCPCSLQAERRDLWFTVTVREDSIVGEFNDTAAAGMSTVSMK